MMACSSANTRPHATAEDIKDLVYSLYGLKVESINKLHGYEDQNFHIKVNQDECENVNITRVCAAGYVVKLMNSYDSDVNAAHVAGEIDLLKLLLDGGIICPRHVPDKSGQLFSKQDLLDKTRTGTSRHIVRLLEYIEGEITSEKCISPKLVRDGGSWLADLHNILEGYEDSRMAREGMLWRYDNLPQFRQHLSLITDEGNRALAAELMDKWDSLQDKLSTLPKGIIYHDLNEANMLVKRSAHDGEWEIAAIIDFQDASHGYKIYDIAIFVVYMMLISDNCLDVGGCCLRGFMEKRKVLPAELDVLYYCVAGRLVISLVVGLLNYSQDPDPCFLETQRSGWKVLKKLWAMPAQEVLQHWLSSRFLN